MSGRADNTYECMEEFNELLEMLSPNFNNLPQVTWFVAEA